MAAIDYEQGLSSLRMLVRQQAPALIDDFNLLEYRLRAALSQQQRYGSSSNNDVERNQVIDQLLQFTNQHFALQFIDLCRDSSNNDKASFDETPVSNSSLSCSSKTWQESDEIHIHDTRYIICSPLSAPVWAQDRSFFYQQAQAIQVGHGRKVWLKQVCVHRDTTQAKIRRAALIQEEHLLNTLEQETQTFPKAITSTQTPHEVTLIHTIPSGLSCLQTFGSPGRPLPATRLGSFFQAMLSLCASLQVLHRHGYTHRFLTPTTVLIPDHRHVNLQNVGLATLPYTPGEGPDEYRAPEQAIHSAKLAVPGPYTDIYQIGKIIYFIVCGRTLPFSRPLPPLSLWNQAVSTEIDLVLIKAIEPNRNDRWQSLRQFSSALRQALQTSTRKKEQP